MAEEPTTTAHSYEVLGKLAEGGTTEIFLARAKGVGAVERFVVLKRLKRAVTSHRELVQAFLTEARLASQLQHPNVAQVFEVGKLGGSYFFAMEFVNGETLQSLMDHARSKKIQIPVRAVLTIASAIAAGLHHAHERRGTDGHPLAIVHGDVSPTNTLVSQEGIVKLVDFGIAKAGDLGGANVSPYASPEQCKGEPVDRRSDLFALGIVLWEVLTLDPLYQRASDDEIKRAIETEEPARPSAKRYDVPPELDAMVQKLLAKNPADRFQDADELLAAIESLAQKLSILLSTADLSRMMRLWFGTKSDPTIDPSAPDAVQPLLVASEPIPDDISATSHTAVDDQLDAVRSAAALITARATRAGSETGRQATKQPTVPPELMDSPDENFEQIRDRILARARAKKETRNPVTASGAPGAEQGHLTSGAVAASGNAPAADDRHTRQTALPPLGGSDRHTRTTAQAPIAVIEEAVRLAGIADPIDAKPNGANGHHPAVTTAPAKAEPAKVEPAKPAPSVEVAKVALAKAAAVAQPAAAEPATDEEPDKVVVDADLSGSRSASGELGNKGTSGLIVLREAKVTVADGGDAPAEAREAPPATTKLTEEKAGGTDDIVARKRNEAARVAEAAARTREAVAREAAAREAAASDADGRADSDGEHTETDAERTERVHHARASTAEIALPTAPRRPAWIVPVLAVACVAAIFFVVMKLRGGSKPTSANAQPAHTVVAPTGAQTPSPVTPQVVPPTIDAAVAVVAPVDAQEAAVATPDAAAQVAQQDPSEGAAKNPGDAKDAGDGAAKNPGEGTKKDRGQKKDPGEQVTKKDPGHKKEPIEKKEPVEKKEPEAAKGIEELFAAGDFAKTNTACTKEIVFNAQKLQMCAEAACQTKNTALAKRWINAIAKASRPDLIEKCKSLGVELEPPPPAAPPPAAPPAAPAPTPATP